MGLGFSLGLLAILFSSPLAISAQTIELVSSEYSPYVMENSKNEVKGIVADIIVKAFEQVHINVSFQILPFPRAVHSLVKESFEAGFFDELTLASSKKDNYICTPFIPFNASLFHKSNDGTAKIPLKGKSVGVLSGNPHDELLLKEMGLNVVKSFSHRSLINLLRFNRVDFISTIDLTGYNLIRDYIPFAEQDEYRIYQEPYYQGTAGLCFVGNARHENQLAFEKGLKKLQQSGFLKGKVNDFLSNYSIIKSRAFK